MFDNIPDGFHKHFMKQYMKDWPYPHLTIYRVGQSLNAEYFGEQQRCEVQAIDCSLIQVVFQVGVFFFFLSLHFNQSTADLMLIHTSVNIFNRGACQVVAQDFRRV